MAKTLLFVSFLMSALYLNAEQTFTAVEMSSGFTQDVICENKDNLASNVTHSPVAGYQGLDGYAFVFYTSDVDSKGALCGPDGTFSSKRTGATFKVNPAGLNALVLKSFLMNNAPIPGAITTGELVFKAPIAAKSIYVVGTSAEGDSELAITIKYSDGTSAENTITMYDWGSSSSAATSAAVVTDLGRMAAIKNWAGEAGHVDAYNFKLYELAVNTDNTRQIKSVGVKLNTVGRCASVFAVSTSNDVVAGIEGIAADSAVPVGYYTPDGHILSAPAKGLNIVKYSDGTVAKVMY